MCPHKKYSVAVTSSFTAAHWHDKTLSEAAHTHNFKYEVYLSGPLNEEGYLVDFRKLEERLNILSKSLEGRLLNDILRNPTTENLACWLFYEVKKTFPQIKKVTVREKENYFAAYEED